MTEQDDDSSKEFQQKESLSICDIMKEGTSEVIKEMESKMPSMFQSYSDMYAKYLHTLDDVFGTCYIAEKEFFDKLNIDQDILIQIKQNSKMIKRNHLEHIDMTSKLFGEYIKMGMKSIESFDNYSHVMLEAYAKMLSQFNKASRS